MKYFRGSLMLKNEQIEEIIKLVKKNHKNFINEKNELFFSENNISQWSSETNIEKLCFKCGPAKQIINKDNILYEAPLMNENDNNNRMDAILTSRKGLFLKNKVFSIIENKIAFDNNEKDKKIEEAISQINHYVDLLKFDDRYDLNHDFFVSICIYNPYIFLRENNPYLNYLNDKFSSIDDKYEKYGILILTKKINIIESKIHINSLKAQKINIIPTIIELTGNLNLNEHFIDKNNFTMNVYFSELVKLPLVNVNPSSKINNPREYVQDTPENATRRLRIFKTMESLYEEDDNTRSRSLGAKNRELAYNINETIIFNYPNPDKKLLFQDLLIIVTTNMSLIDGQHSTRAFIDLYNNKYGNLDKSFYNQDDFKNKISKYYFGLNFKGYNNVELALNASINQNNISKQKKMDEFLLQYRDHIIRLANYYNGKTSYILNFNKSSYNSDLVNINNNIVVWAHYFTYIWGVFVNSTNKDILNAINDTLSNNSKGKTTPSQGYALKDSILWVFEQSNDKDILRLEEKISKYLNMIQDNKEIENNDDYFEDNFDKDKELDSLFTIINNLKVNDNCIMEYKSAFCFHYKDLKEEKNYVSIDKVLEKFHKYLLCDLKIKETLLTNIINILGSVKFNCADEKYEKNYKTKVVMVTWMIIKHYHINMDKFEKELLDINLIKDCINIIDKYNYIYDIKAFKEYILKKENYL